MEDTRRTWSTESTKQGSHLLTETEVENSVPTWVWNRSSGPMWWWLVSCSCDTPKSGSGYILHLVILGCFWVSFTSIRLPCPALIWLLLSCLVIPCFVLSAVFWRPAFLKKQRRSGLRGAVNVCMSDGAMNNGERGNWLECIEKKLELKLKITLYYKIINSWKKYLKFENGLVKYELIPWFGELQNSILKYKIWAIYCEISCKPNESPAYGAFYLCMLSIVSM